MEIYIKNFKNNGKWKVGKINENEERKLRNSPLLNLANSVGKILDDISKYVTLVTNMLQED